LRELKGKPLIVYFYPKDDTPGCTIEAKGIRDQYAELNGRAVVLGISEDSLDSHKTFRRQVRASVFGYSMTRTTRSARASGYRSAPATRSESRS